MSNGWFYEEGGGRKGPVPTADLKKLIDSGTVTRDTLIWREGLENWIKAKSVKGLFSTPPPLPKGDSGIQAPAAAPPPVVGNNQGKGTEPAAVAKGGPQPVLRVFLPLALSFVCAAAGLLVLALLAARFRLVSAAGFFFVVSCLAFFALYCISGVIVYRSWAALPEAFRSRSPGIAAGLLFVPVFNLYWAFLAVRGFTMQVNKALASGGNGHRASERLALICCIAFCVSFALLLASDSFIHVLLGICAGTAFHVLWLFDTDRALRTLNNQRPPPPGVVSLKWASIACLSLAFLVPALMSRSDGTQQPQPMGPYGAARERPEDLSAIGGYSTEEVEQWERDAEMERQKIEQGRQMMDKMNDAYRPRVDRNGGGVVQDPNR